MQQSIAFPLCLLLSLSLCWPATAQTLMDIETNQPYSEEWKAIDSLTEAGLYRSALEKVEELYPRTITDRQAGHSVKCLLQRQQFQQVLNEDGRWLAIRELEVAVEQQTGSLKAALQSLLAEQYYSFYQQVQWQIGDRTRGAEPPNDDFTTWTSADLINHSTELYLASTQELTTRQQSLDPYRVVLSEAVNTDGLRPTLYDLLIHRALEHFRSNDAFLGEPRVQTDLTDPILLAERSAFLNWSVPSSDPATTAECLIRLLQEALAWRANTPNEAALLDLDLIRLKLLHEHLQHPDKDALYTAALQRLRRQFADRPEEAVLRWTQMEWLWQRGTRYNNEENNPMRWAFRDALAIGEDINTRFPESIYADKAQHLSAQIRQPSLRVHIEQVYLPGKHGLVGLQYHNVGKLFFKLYEIQTDDYLYRPNDQENLNRLLRRRALQSWNENLPDPGDYRPHFTEASFKSLPTGVYTLLVSDNREFSIDGGAVTSLSFWVSNLGLLTSELPGEGLQIMVLNRETGAPIPGVNVTQWTQGDNRRSWVRGASRRTDAQGRLLLSDLPQSNFRLQLQRGRDELFSTNSYYRVRDLYRQQPYRQTHYFLDRAIYRPGQTIHFKVLLTEADERRIPEIVPGAPIIVTLHDPNGQEVERQELTTNSYGTAAGTFTAPSGGLMGSFTINSDQGYSTSLRVEEYKRPRFEVEMEPLDGQPQLGEEVTATGRAVAYAGPALQGAKVRYTVRRRVQYPWYRAWYGRSYYPRPAAAYVVKTGETSTDESGRFTVSFLAEGDGAIASSRFPMYVFELSAEVIDVTGETHAGSKYIRLADYALRIDLNAPEKHDRQSELVVQVKSTNLDGQAQASVGRLIIEQLEVPDNIFVDRYWQKPDEYVLNPRYFRRQFRHLAYGNEDEEANWPVDHVQHQSVVNTGESERLSINVTDWPVGVYRMTYSVQTAAGDSLQTSRIIRIYDWAAGSFPKDEVLWVDQMTELVEPGEEGYLRLATAEGEAFVFVDVSRDNEMLLQQWEYATPTTNFRFVVREADRGGLALQLLSVRWNRFFTQQHSWQVPWTNKQLSIHLETFRDKLYPDQDEEWTLRIDGSERDRVAAEVVASMYDASLDQIIPHQWNLLAFPDRGYVSRLWRAGQFQALSNITMTRNWHQIPNVPERRYPLLLASNQYNVQLRGLRRRDVQYDPMTFEMEADDGAIGAAAPAGVMAQNSPAPKTAEPPPPPEELQEEEVSPPTKVRTNLSETAFFFPQLATNDNGEVLLKFRSPESLTKWKLQLFAHDADLAFAYASREVVTQKELMILPNAPRFMREGDELEFTAKVSNLSGGTLRGTARLELFDLTSGSLLNETFGLNAVEQTFSLRADQSAGLAWRLDVPTDATGVIGYRVVAEADQFADGEEAALPVLTNQVLLTETLPMFVRSGKTASFRLRSLQGAADDIRHQSLTFDLTSNPAWLAVKSMPYLLEYPHECTEQLVNRLFANSLSAHLVGQFPRLEAVFDSWQSDPAALQSPLLANEELKSALIEETPWVLEAQNEQLQRERLALLFDLDRMGTEQAVALDRLAQRQLLDGGFGWFPGSQHSRHITQYVVEVIAHLEALGVPLMDRSPELKEVLDRALLYCDRRAGEEYQRLQEDVEAGRRQLQEDQLNNYLIHYLYLRSFFRDLPIDQELEEMHSYYLGQAVSFWTRKGLYEQGLLALALHREERPSTAQAILASLQERAIRSDELGMYWPYNEGFYWYQRPLETHALLMEVFHTLGASTGELDELRLWLLRHKETNRWETTKATSAAIYALLISSGEGIGESELVQASFPRAKNSLYRDRIEQAELSAEAGTGYYQVQWTGEEVDKDLATVRLRNRNDDPAWGNLYWQYFQTIDQVEEFADTPLKVERGLFRTVSTDEGEVLMPLDNPPKPGDKVTIRLVLRTDRDMEFLHLKDLRAAAFEPIDQLSGYRYRDGLGYYQSTTDIGTHFFFDRLPQGSYVIEYDVWVTYRGDFSAGLATFQCMYAPAYSSHSEGTRVRVE